MTARKNRTTTTSHKSKKGRQAKADSTDHLPNQAASPAEPVTAVAAENPAGLTTEPLGIAPPTPAVETTTAAADLPLNETTQPHKLSALDAAAKVLAESGQAMSCAQLIAAMAAKGYWHSPKGKTPAATLYSAVLREIQTKGQKARFGKTVRGKFALRMTE